MPTAPAYQRLAQLTDGHPSFTASELHGVLSGMLCADRGLDCGQWLELLSANDVDTLTQVERELLSHLFDTTRDELTSPDFDFHLLLPDDAEPLVDRARALGEWCRGFLYGFGERSGGPECSDESAEVLQDFADISRIEAEDSTDQDETDFMEIAEYVRMAVQMLRIEHADHPRHRLH